MRSFEAAGGKQVLQAPLSCVHDLLKPSLCFCAVPVPHCDTICQYTLCGGPVKGHKQLLAQIVLPESSQEVAAVPFWLSAGDRSRIGQQR